MVKTVGYSVNRIIAGALVALASGCGDNRPGSAVDATEGGDHVDMISVPIPGGGAYYIDSGETTNAAYARFLTANPFTANQPPYCNWNAEYTSELARGNDNDPVQGVDWCDAYAYCHWVGKHLCGKIGGGSLSYLQNDWKDPMKSEWYNACSAGGAKAYPYGDIYNGGTCVGQDYDGMTGTQSSDVVHPTKDASGCVGGYPGLYDMSGNVAEWEDTCDGTTGKDDICLARGGGAYAPAYNLQCGPENIASRSSKGARLGFRCCAN